MTASTASGTTTSYDIDLADDVDELRKAVVELNAKLDRLVAAK